MNWKKFMDEGDYQDFLLRALTVARTGKDRFRKRTNADYCREYAMDKALVIERYLTFIDPKGLRNLAFDSPKLNFAVECKNLQNRLNHGKKDKHVDRPMQKSVTKKIVVCMLRDSSEYDTIRAKIGD